MTRWSSFLMPWAWQLPTHRRPTLLPWSVVPRLTVVPVLIAAFVCCPLPVLARLTCGTQPEISPVNAADDITGHVKAKADAIIQAYERAGLRVFVTAQRRELRKKYPDADKSMLDTYLLWMTCSTLSDDPDIPASQQFDEYSNLYRLLSEPIDKATPAAE